MFRRLSDAGRRNAVRRRARGRWRLSLETLEPRQLLTTGTPDITEMTPLSTLTLGSGDQTLIEIGGPQPGNPEGGNAIDGYDQIQVDSLAELGGILQVKLVNGYVPPIGATFDFLTTANPNAVTGKFDGAEGLFAFPDGDRFFAVVPQENGLQLVVAEIPGQELRFQPPVESLDEFGMFLDDYFEQATTFSYTGGVSVEGFAQFSGSVVLQKDGALLKIGADNVTAFVGSGFETAAEIGVKVQDAGFGLVIDTSSATAKYALQVTEGTGGIVGVAGVDLMGPLAVAVNHWGEAVNLSVPTLEAAVPVVFDAVPVMRASGTVDLVIEDFFSVSGVIAVERSSRTLTLADKSTVAVFLRQRRVWFRAGEQQPEPGIARVRVLGGL